MSKIPVNVWHREETMDRERIVRFQVLVYCHLAGIDLTRTELECMTLLGLREKSELRYLCSELVELQMYTSSDSARGAIDRLCGKGLLEKEGKNRKIIYLASAIALQSKGTILLDIKCLCRQ